jgi:hypothetical protein
MKNILSFGLTIFVCFQTHAEPTNAKVADLINESISAKNLRGPMYDRLIPPCQAQWRTIASTRVSSILEMLIEKKFTFDSSCRTYDEQIQFKEFVNSTYETCKVGPENLIQRCSTFLTMYRAAIIDQMTIPENGTKEDYSSLANSVLANKQIARFFHPPEGPDSTLYTHLNDILEINRVLRERLPQSFDLLKWSIMLRYRMLHKPASSEPAIDPAQETKLVSQLAEAEKLSPNDPSLRELRWVLLLEKNNLSQFETKIISFLKENQNDEAALYWRAFLYWKNKDKRQTTKTLEKAKKGAPESERIKVTLDKLKNAKFGDKIFDFKFGATMNDLI